MRAILASFHKPSSEVAELGLGLGPRPHCALQPLRLLAVGTQPTGYDFYPAVPMLGAHYYNCNESSPQWLGIGAVPLTQSWRN